MHDINSLLFRSSDSNNVLVSVFYMSGMVHVVAVDLSWNRTEQKDIATGATCSKDIGKFLAEFGVTASAASLAKLVKI